MSGNDADIKRQNAITDAVIEAASRGYEDDSVLKAARGESGDPIALLIVQEIEAVAPYSEDEEEARTGVYNALEDVIGRLRDVQEALLRDS